MRYVMADIHGQYQLLLAMLEKINFSPADQLIIIGDLADRGPNPLEVIHFAMEMPNVHLIRGNHDQMILDYFANKPGAEARWMRNGGDITKRALLAMPSAQRHRILRWLEATPLYVFMDRFLLVHAGIRPYPGLPTAEVMAKQEVHDLLWIREDFYTQPALPDYTVIFGHSRTPRLWGQEKMDIWHDPVHHDKIGIDCWANGVAQGGRLACLSLDSGQEFYVPESL